MALNPPRPSDRSPPYGVRPGTYARRAVPRARATASPAILSSGLSYRLVWLAVLFVLLTAMGSFSIVGRSIYGEWVGKSGDTFTTLLRLITICASLFVLWCGTYRLTAGTFRRSLPLAAAGLLLLSALWSLDPTTSIRTGVGYFAIVLFVMGAVDVLDARTLLNTVALACVLSAVASLAQYLILPEPGDFRGVFSHKNVLGQVMAAGVLANLHGLRVTPGRGLRYLSAIVLCMVVAVMSKSSTSLVTIVVFLTLEILGRLYLRGGAARMSSLLVILCGAIVVIAGASTDLALEVVGKDATLTGRTDLWPYVLEYIGQRPVLGWGYYAFWMQSNFRAMEIGDALRWPVANSHNTALEMLLSIGIVGFVLYCVIYIRNFTMALKCLHGPGKDIGLTTTMFLVGILLTGTTEVLLLSADQIWTVLFFMLGFLCEKRLSAPIPPRRQRGNAS